jgi:hypothetical protein
MNLHHKSNKILITGQSGSGKSTYFAFYALNAWKEIYDQILVFDHQGELAYRLGVPAVTDPEQLDEVLAEKNLVIFDPSDEFPGDTLGAWAFFCEWGFSVAQREPALSKCLCADELQIYVNTHNLDHSFSCVIETGRKYGLAFCGVAQQANLLHNRLRNQLTEIVSFRHSDALILDALEEHGFDPEELRRMVDGEYICRSLQGDREDRGNILTCPGVEIVQP